MWMRRSLIAVMLFLFVRFAEGAESTNSATPSAVEESLNFVQQRLSKSIADATWFGRLQGVAGVDKVRFVGPAPQNLVQRQITTNGVIIPAYTFMPVRKHRGKLPLIVLLHTEVHGDFNPDDDFRVTRELVEQGYAVIAPDYRGSTGYGGGFWGVIYYGGGGGGGGLGGPPGGG